MKIGRLIALVAALGLVPLAACAQNKKVTAMNGENRILVAYFSATGTTERVAKTIASVTGGELFRITPTEEYSSADLDWTDSDSRCCRENDNPAFRPAFVRTKESLDGYDTIYLGFPNWWNGAPRIINTFIEAYGLKGKTVIPFMTSGGSGISNSMKVFRAAYPDVNWKDGKLLNGASRRTVEDWVNKK